MQVVSSLAFQRHRVENLGVETEGSLGNERGGDDDSAANGEVHTTDGAERVVDVTVGDKVPVDDATQQRRLRTREQIIVSVTNSKWSIASTYQDRVEDDVRAVQEGHDGTESRDVLVFVSHLVERRLNVGGQRNVTGSPSVRDRDESGGDNPG